MRLLSLSTALPDHSYTQAEIWDWYQKAPWFSQLRTRSQSILQRILEADHGIETRHFATDDPNAVFEKDAGDLNRDFEREAPKLAGQALCSALDTAGFSADQLDALVICTCTGYLCPGVTSFVAESLGCRPDIEMIDLVGLGCGASIPALRAAENMVRTRPGARVGVVAVELASAAFYADDDPGVLVSLCLFGDGAAAAVVTGEVAGEAGGWSINHFQSYHQPHHREEIRFVNQNGKLKNQLHRTVPALAAGAVETLYRHPHAGGSGRRLLSHTGGRDVLDAIEAQLPLEVCHSREVLRECGNMSSPSVLFALERQLKTGDTASLWLTAFGAGFTAYSCCADYC